MSNASVKTHIERFIESLGPRYSQICREFEKIHENSERVKFMGNFLKDYGFLGDSAVLRETKLNAFVERSRHEGNKFFVKRQFLEALECYNKSLCFAEPGSEHAGLAYSNRSAVFMEMKLFKLCLENIEKAKQHNAPAKTCERLEKRKEKCLEMIRDGVKETSGDPVGAEFFKLSRDPHPDVPFIVDCLQLKKNKEFGRHIVATKELKPGEVISVEEPFFSLLESKERYNRCANCLKENFLDLHPCSTCTVTMFCSKECEEVGNRKFHQFECPIVDRLNSLDAICSHLAIRTFFEAFDVCGGKIQQMKTLVQENSPDTTVFDFKHPTSRVNMLKVVNALETNEKKKCSFRLFVLAADIAIFCNLLINYTKLGDILESEDDRNFLRSFMFKFTQIATVNNNCLSEIFLKNGNLVPRTFGTGMSLFHPLVNHSCAPNIFPEVFNGKHCYIVNRLIEAGQQIFANYYYPHNIMLREERQEHLEYHFQLICNCEACKLDYPLQRDLNATDFLYKLQYWNDVSRLSQFDQNFAKERVEHYRQILTRYAHEYPSKETVMAFGLIRTCFNVFSSSEFKVKLIAK